MHTHTAIPYRVSTGPEQGFPCVLFPNRENPVFIAGIPANANRFFPVRKSTQGKPCFQYRDGFAVYSGQYRDYGLDHSIFIRNKTFLFFKIERLNLRLKFHETSQNFNSFSPFRQFLFLFFLLVV